MNLRIRGPFGCLLLALAIIVVAALLPGYLTSPNRWPRDEFVREQWLDTPPDQRYVYARSLVESELLLGADRSEVVALLGEPSFEAGGSYLGYTVKHAEPYELSFDFTYFIRLELDASGRVRRQTIGSD